MKPASFTILSQNPTWHVGGYSVDELLEALDAETCQVACQYPVLSAKGARDEARKRLLLSAASASPRAIGPGRATAAGSRR